MRCGTENHHRNRNWRLSKKGTNSFGLMERRSCCRTTEQGMWRRDIGLMREIVMRLYSVMWCWDASWQTRIIVRQQRNRNQWRMNGRRGRRQNIMIRWILHLLPLNGRDQSGKLDHIYIFVMSADGMGLQHKPRRVN